jgi:ketosteroid isomerase-like protein
LETAILGRGVSTENVELVRTALTALNRRDVEAYLSVVSPQIELINPASELEGPSIGHDGIRRFFSELDTWADISFQVEDIAAVGERVLALFTLSGQGPMSGVAMSTKLAGVYEFADGRIRRVQIFTDRTHASEVARTGL